MCASLSLSPVAPSPLCQVVQLLWGSRNFIWAWVSITLLVGQFFIVWIRVIPYLSANFGADSTIYRGWLFLGFPAGCVALDGLMFLEPFGLLTVIPFPDWLRQFLPAYKATRIIAEVVVESLPQCVLQSIIYVLVIQACGADAPESAVCPERYEPRLC